MAWRPCPDLEGGRAMTGQPIMELIRGGYRCTYPDDTALEATAVRHEQKGRLYATVTAIHAGKTLHRADFNLLDQKAQADFHKGAATLNGYIQWRARLHCLTTGILDHEQQLEANEPAEPPIIPALQVPAECFPVAMLPTPMRRLVEDGAKALPCPADFIAVHTIIAVAGAIGNSVKIEVKQGWVEGAQIFGGCIGDPGSKKSPGQAMAVAPLYRAQERSANIFKKRKEQYEKDADAYEVKLGAWKAEAREARRKKLDPPQMPEPLGARPTMAQVWTSDTTTEAFAELLQQNPRGIMLVRDELTAWVLGMNQYKGGRGADRQFWLSIWNGVPVTINRKGQDPIVIDHPFGCISGCLPPDVLGDLTDERGRDDGLLDRLLLAYPDPVPAEFPDDIVSDEVVDTDKNLIDKILIYGSDTHTMRVTLRPEARKVFLELQN